MSKPSDPTKQGPAPPPEDKSQFDAGVHADLNYAKRIMREGSKADKENQYTPLELAKMGLRGSKEEYEHSAQTLHRNPCFRDALLWGIGLGALFGLHRFKETGNPLKFVDWMVGGWVSVSLLSWGYCRRNDFIRLSAMSEWYDDRTSGKLDEKIKAAREKFEAKLSQPKPSSDDTDISDRS